MQQTGHNVNDKTGRHHDVVMSVDAVAANRLLFSSLYGLKNSLTRMISASSTQKKVKSDVKKFATDLKWQSKRSL